jgi:hypothetical protein|nr:MAG TPA: hypothetical protein [Caudoviricetes sp.]
MDITKETLIEHIENLFNNIDAGEPTESTVELTALGAEIKLNLSTLAYGAIILLDGTTWFKEDSDMWTTNDGAGISQLELAQSIRAANPGDAVFLYNGEVYR